MWIISKRRREHMRHVNGFSTWLIVGAVVVGSALLGSPAQSRAASASIESKADRILQNMSRYLSGIDQFKVQTENTLEVVLRSGEKLQFDMLAELSLRRPDKFYAARTDGMVNQQLYYDGKSLTLYSADHNDYATVAAPPTIEEALDFARTSLDIYAPGSDLIYKNAYAILTEDVMSGFYVGMGVVGGIKCHHLAFLGNEVDWQIWIEDGDKPFPRKFIITSKWLTGAPQYTIVMKTWTLSPELSERLFTFVPPKGAQKTDFIPLARGGNPQR
jgi:hypothetical protein